MPQIKKMCLCLGLGNNTTSSQSRPVQYISAAMRTCQHCGICLEAMKLEYFAVQCNGGLRSTQKDHADNSKQFLWSSKHLSAPSNACTLQLSHLFPEGPNFGNGTSNKQSAAKEDAWNIIRWQTRVVRRTTPLPRQRVQKPPSFLSPSGKNQCNTIRYSGIAIRYSGIARGRNLDPRRIVQYMSLQARGSSRSKQDA
jgi:hypothetical protein